MRRYKWYHTAMECLDCEHKFVVDGHNHRPGWSPRCPKCRSSSTVIDSERDLAITEAIAETPA